MCAAQSNPQQSFGYAWGFADGNRTESVLEISPNINYIPGGESMPYLLSTTDGALTVQKDGKGLAGGKTNVVRRMFVVNEPFGSGAQRVITAGPSTVVKKQDQQVLSINCDKNYLLVDPADHSHSFTNGTLDTKPPQPQSVLQTAAGAKTHFGPIQLTAEECNEILMKRAFAVSQQTTSHGHHHNHLHHNHSAGTSDILPGISVQVQKVIQGLEDGDDSQGDTPNLKLEPGTLELSPKTELQESIHFSDNDATIKKERPYSCDECGKSFLLKHHLTTHARVHTGERPHICPHCSKSFAHKHCLNTHLLLHSTDRPYQCTECKKSFTLKHHLLTHMRVHSRDRPFICQECGRSFPLKRHLVTHSKFHAGERPYVCEECGESFAQENHLIMHSRFHGSVNPFVCPDCGVTFPRKFQLVNHGRIHGKVPHSCTVCGKEFLQKRTLVTHMRIHTGDQPYPCISCGEGFMSKAELNQHIRNTHGGVNPNSGNTTIVPSNTIITQHPTHVQHHQTHQLQHQQQGQPGHPQTIVVSNPNSALLTVTANDGNSINRPQFACRDCGSAFNSREALALHLRLHTGDKSLMTDLCALTAALPGHFLSTATLNPGATVVATNPNIVAQNGVPVQIISSTGQVMSQTTLVQAATSTHPQTLVTTVPTVAVHSHQQQLQAANAQHHHQHQQPQQQQQQPQTPNKPKSHFCVSCGKGFAAKHGLMQHNRRHPNGGCTVRTHVCECGKAFFQKNHLMLHQRQHLEAKPAISQQQDGMKQVQQEQQQQQQQQQQQHIIHQENPDQQQQQQQQQQQVMDTRELLINNQPMQVQVLQGGTQTPQVVKYEINMPQDG